MMFSGEWFIRALIPFILTFLAILGCALMAGTFFAFSAFVMKALKRLPSEEGIAAMQSINITVINPLFMAVFVGTGLLCAVLAVYSIAWLQNPGAVYILIGSMLYLVGTFLVTILFNVPRNNLLKDVDAVSEEGSRVWVEYVKSWTAWNHVRTTAALAAAASLTFALCC